VSAKDHFLDSLVSHKNICILLEAPPSGNQSCNKSRRNECLMQSNSITNIHDAFLGVKHTCILDSANKLCPLLPLAPQENADQTVGRGSEEQRHRGLGEPRIVCRSDEKSHDNRPCSPRLDPWLSLAPSRSSRMLHHYAAPVTMTGSSLHLNN
jgi:hypothetical protein